MKTSHLYVYLSLGGFLILPFLETWLNWQWSCFYLDWSDIFSCHFTNWQVYLASSQDTLDRNIKGALNTQQQFYTRDQWKRRDAYNQAKAVSDSSKHVKQLFFFFLIYAFMIKIYLRYWTPKKIRQASQDLTCISIVPSHFNIWRWRWNYICGIGCWTP